MMGGENNGRCYSSANRHSHYNRQRVLFEKNLNQLEPVREAKVSQHVQMIAEMFDDMARGNRTARGQRQEHN